MNDFFSNDNFERSKGIMSLTKISKPFICKAHTYTQDYDALCNFSTNNNNKIIKITRKQNKQNKKEEKNH